MMSNVTVAAARAEALCDRRPLRVIRAIRVTPFRVFRVFRG
jgi:hypothetical protein